MSKAKKTPTTTHAAPPTAKARFDATLKRMRDHAEAVGKVRGPEAAKRITDTVAALSIANEARNKRAAAPKKKPEAKADAAKA